MKRLAIVLALLLSAQAHAQDGKPVLRMIYAKLWTPVIMNMFADAGPTTVKLVRNRLVITNPNCNDPLVKASLAETFGAAKSKLREIGMTVQCVTNALAMN